MIFGFNTDVQHNGVVYHVQSELRQTDRVLETQVFVHGRCVGKQSAALPRPDLNELEIHELLKTQHRRVLESVREGGLANMVSPPESEPPLILRWLSAQPQAAEGLLVLRFRLTANGAAVTGARVCARFENIGDASGMAEGQSGSDGEIELRLPLAAASADTPSLQVDVTEGARSLTQKFRLRKK